MERRRPGIPMCLHYGSFTYNLKAVLIDFLPGLAETHLVGRDNSLPSDEDGSRIYILGFTGSRAGHTDCR